MKLTDEKILELAVASKLARLNGTQHVVAHWPDTDIGLELVTFARAVLKAAGVEELEQALEEARRAIGDHYAPSDCYATGPMAGDPIRDLVQCPACSAIAPYEKAMKAK